MIGKAVALALASAPIVASPADVTPTYTNIPQVKMVLCAEGSGTAWRNGVGSYVTAAHVASLHGCAIDGEPITITYINGQQDIAVLRTKVWGVPLKINCDGMPDGQPFAGVGYAEGLPMQRVIFAVESDKLTALTHWKGFRALYGQERFIPGMSGGVVLNQLGEVVGIVNGFATEAPVSFSESLSDTPLCK